VGESLERQARLFHRIEEMVPVGGWEFDLRTGQLFWSEETYRIHDTTPDSYHPTFDTAVRFFAPESLPILEDAIDRALRLGVRYDLELRLITAKGRSIWIRTTGAADCEAGQPVRLSGAVQDITDRVLDRESLRDSEARLAGVVAMALDAIVVVTQDGVIALFNHAAETMFGVPAADALSQPASRFFPEWNSGFAEDGRHRGRGERGNGERFDCEAAIARASHGAGTLTTVIVRDLSDLTRAEASRELLEQQLRQANKMEAIGTLAGGIAHDFNNILGAVLGNAEMVLADLPAGHPARLSLEQILRSTDRATQLVRRILAFSREQEQLRRPIPLEDVIRESIQLLRATLPSSIELTADLVPGAPLVLADEGQMQQVLMILCTNAAQAIGERPGKIGIELTVVDLDAAAGAALPHLRAGRFVRVSVTDDGPGMSAETLERVFDPFFTTRHPGEGSGLGLSVAYGIARTHEGCIVGFSQPGRGSAFHFYLPTWEIAAAPTAPAQAVVKGHGERVLLIDDEHSLIFLGEMLLRRLGYRVISFTDPVAALAEVRRDDGSIRLIVTDLTMPVIGGLEVAREVQRMKPGLPVLITTGYAGKLDEVTLQKDGIVGVVQKPYTTAALGRAIRDAIAGIPMTREYAGASAPDPG
jgi:two-component system, cell cycle sensor histidine kinase and response regulator CckA